MVMKRFALIGVVSLLLSIGFVACSSENERPQEEPLTDAPQDSDTLSARADQELTEVVNQTLGLRASVVASVALDGAVATGIRLQVPIAEQVQELELHEHSVRAEGYKVLAQLEDGSYEEVAPGPIRTLRGIVSGVPDSVVAATLEEDGIYARIFLPDGEQYWVEPIALKVADAAADQYAVYRNEDIIQPQKTCGFDDIVLQPERSEQSVGLRRPQGTGACGTGLCQAQVAADADFEYFQFWGSVLAVTNRINNVINAVNVQYERDVDITQVVTTIIVRTTSSDPYSSADPVTLLNQFRTHWLNNQGGVQRDLAQLFTGRDLNGTTIGIAWLEGVCNSLGFSVVQSDFTGSFGCVTDLSAHEFGHNWGADHCSCSGYTMNPSITCANQFHPTFDIPEISLFRDSRTCLTGVVGGCSGDADCDDGDDCNGLETCNGGTCQSGTPVNCNDANACTTDSCAPATGLCSNTPVNCNDGNACTADICNPASGCVHTPLAECCGNDTCELGEDCTTCPGDCPSGGGAGCGNGVCEPTVGEDCLSCSADCNGQQSGPPSQRFCCGDGAGQNPVDCNNDPENHCNVGAWACGASPDPFCCGDGLCEGGEQCICPADCGAPPASETSCTDGVDNDCDGSIDCTDGNCSGNPACPSCGAPGAPCSNNSDCCSNKCKGNGTCR